MHLIYSPSKLAQGTALTKRYAGMLACLLVALVCLQPALLHAQNAPANSIAQIVGDDISIEGGSSASVGDPNGGPVHIFNGSVVTVHTGRAKLTFAAGGEVAICGPAKITILQSAG